MVITVGTTVEELILADIKSTVEGIDGNPDWNTEVQKVDVVDGDSVDQIEVPWVGIFHAHTETTHPGLTQKVALYHLVLAMSNGTDTPVSDIGRFRDDVATALHQTHTRDGNARDTRMLGSEILTKTYEHSKIQATLTFEVVFAHPFGDPTTPK